MYTNKSFWYEALVRLVALLVGSVILVWVLLVAVFACPVMLISACVLPKSYTDEIREKALNALVLPYKWLGVCDDWNSFCFWVQMNR